MKHGVLIDKGLSDWQIIQQDGGEGTLKIKGRWYPFENIPASADQMDLTDPSLLFQVYVRVVYEDSGMIVIPWKAACMTGQDTWEAKISGVPSGGLYRVETCLDHNKNYSREWAYRGDMIHHIGVGDLYVITGQSNSSGYGKDPVYDPAIPGVHILKNSGRWDMASNPLNESTGTLHLNTMENANPGVSPYLSFARQINRTAGIPVGLIQTSKGGSSLAEWDITENGHLYRTMLETVLSCTDKVRGILWYQGCSDASPEDSVTYLDRFTGFTSRLRKDLNDPGLPFLTCQLNRHITRETNDDWDRSWGRVRNAQRIAARSIPGVYVIPTIDASLSDPIHISSASNIQIGERLAATALRYIYGMDVLCDAPDVSGVRLYSENEIELEFVNVSDRIFDYDTPPDRILFKAEDSSGILSVIDYHARGNKIILKTDRTPGPDLRVHHVPGKDFTGQPFKDSTTHLPVLAFYDVRPEDV